MSKKKRRSRLGSVLAALGLVLLALGFVATLVFLYFKSKDEKPVFATEKPKIATIVRKAVATGSMVPRREIQLKPRVSGIIRKLLVEPGQVVKKGALIAEIRIVPNMAALTDAEGSVDRARIALRHAEVELRRAEQLSKDGLLARRRLAERRLDRDLRKAELGVASRKLRVVRDGATRRSDDQANTKVRSTVSGTVLEVPVEEGGSVIQSNNFNDGTTIALVADMNDMIFLGRVDEADVGKIKVGMAANIKIGAIDERRFSAKLEYIAPKGKEIEGAIQFEIKAAVKPEKGLLIRAGYSANAEIVLDRKVDVLAIRETLLQFEGEKTYVEVELAPGKYERRDLELGISDGINIEVKKGVDANTLIKKPEPDKKK